MNLIKVTYLLLQVYIYLILSLETTNCSKYVSHQPSVKDIDSVFTLFQNFNQTDVNSMTEMGQTSDRSEHQCSSYHLLDKFFQSITPDDYEIGVNMNFYSRVQSMKDVNEKVERLIGWSKNVSKTYEPLLNRIQMRLSESLMLIDIPDDCLKSLVRIGVAINDRELWALRCEYIKHIKIS